MSPPTAIMKPDKSNTGMILPVSKETFFNTKWVPKQSPLCPYDMVYHPPDYNPKCGDGQDPKVIKKNIWDQELHKIIPSTSHLKYGRPTIKTLDFPNKQYVMAQVKNDNPHTRIFNVLEWATLLIEGKELCQQ